MFKLTDIIITDPTDQDVYKFSMQNFLFCMNLLRERVQFKLFNRGKIKFPIGFSEQLRYQVNAFDKLVYTDEMLNHIWKSMPWLRYEYVFYYLKHYKYNPKIVEIVTTIKRDELDQPYEDIDIKIGSDMDGAEYGEVIPWETQLMAVMSELYNFMSGRINLRITREEQYKRNFEKLNFAKEHNISFALFGMRRRFDKHEEDMFTMDAINICPDQFKGTSNVMFGRRYGIKLTGTIAHELTEFMACVYGPVMANQITCEKWVEVYQGALGTFLPDTYTTANFLRSFSLLHAKLSDGLREDSAPNTDIWVDSVINFYKQKNINPALKHVIHSNGIDSLDKMLHLNDYRKAEIIKSLGIGTWFTHDVFPVESDEKAVNWVIKLTAVWVNGIKKYAVKLGDGPGKVTSISPKTVENYKYELELDEFTQVF